MATELFLYKDNESPIKLPLTKDTIQKNVAYGEQRMVFGSLLTPVFLTNDKGDKYPFCVIVPSMRLAFDPSSYGDSGKMSAELDFGDAKNYKHVQNALNAFKALDEKFESDVVKHRSVMVPGMKETGPAAKSNQQVRESYVRITRPRTSAKSDRAWPPRMSVNLSNAKNLTPETKEYKKGDAVTTLILCTGLCARDNKIQPSWKVLQIRHIKDGFPYPDQNLSEEEAFGVQLSHEGSGAVNIVEAAI
jgi:hypothetical protein